VPVGVDHPRGRVIGLVLVAVVAIGVAACAPKVRLALPAGTGTPLTDVSAAEQAARASCQAHPAVTADLRLSGRIDGDRVRGTLQVGVARDAMRLEGLAPFGGPVFVLAARPGQAVLLLPRESAVARGSSSPELLDAVVGVALSPADLLAIVSGCGVADWQVRGGGTFDDVWTRLDLDGGRVIWLQAKPGGPPVLVAAADGRWQIEYTRTGTGWPTAIRLRSVAGAASGQTDAVFALDAPEALAALPDGALDVDVPAGAREVSLGDLRARRGLTER
jgi:hypothetical protein